MNDRRPIKAVALLGMVGVLAVQHLDACHAVAEPARSPQYGESMQGSLSEVAEHLKMLRASSITIKGNDLTAIGIDAPQTFLSIGPDGRPTLAGMESVTVTADSIVVAFDRSSEPELPDVQNDVAQDTLTAVAENLTTLRVTSITTDGTDLTSMGISVQQDLFSTDGDGRVALTGISSVTVSEDKFVLVFDRARETESNLAGSSLTPVPKTCHMEVTPKIGTAVEVVCKGTRTEGSCVLGIKTEVTRAEADAGDTGPVSATFFCSCR